MRQYDYEVGGYLGALFAEEFVEIFEEADNDYDRGPREPDKEKNGKEMHRELQKCGHPTIVNPGMARQLLSLLRNVRLGLDGRDFQPDARRP